MLFASHSAVQASLWLQLSTCYVNVQYTHLIEENSGELQIGSCHIEAEVIKAVIEWHTESGYAHLFDVFGLAVESGQLSLLALGAHKPKSGCVHPELHHRIQV